MPSDVICSPFRAFAQGDQQHWKPSDDVVLPLCVPGGLLGLHSPGLSAMQQSEFLCRYLSIGRGKTGHPQDLFSQEGLLGRSSSYELSCKEGMAKGFPEANKRDG